MNSARRFASALVAAVAASTGVAHAQTAPPEPAPALAAATPRPAPAACATAVATLNSAVDTTVAKVGDVFTFTIVPVADGGTPVLAPGLLGYGVVTHSEHAQRDRGGRLAVDARFVIRADGSHVAAVILGPEAYVEGSKRELPFFVGALGSIHSVPFQVASGLATGYNIIHYGGQSVIPKGTSVRLLIGDDYLIGGCTVPQL